MNDVPGPNGTAAGQDQSMDFSTDQAVENAALAGAAAIQKLVAERNELRNRLAAQEHEAAAYRAANTDLRKRLVLIHRHYVDLAKRVVGDLERLDGTIREIAQEAHPAQAGQAQAQEAQAAQQAPAPQEQPQASQEQAQPQEAGAVHWVEAVQEAVAVQPDEAAQKAAQLNGSAQAKS